MDGTDSHLKSLLPKTEFSRRGVRRHVAGRRVRAGGPAGLGATITTDTEGLRPARSRSRWPTARSPPTGRCRPRAGRSRWCWSSRRSSASTSTSRTSAGGFAKLGYFADRAGDVRPAGGRLEARPRYPGDHQDRLQGPRRPGDVRPRRDRRLRQGDRQGRHGEARHHRLLLGRPDRLALRRPQPGPQGRRRLVRPARSADKTSCSRSNPIDVVADLKAPVLGLYGGADQGIPVADGREDARGPQGRRQAAEIVLYPDTPHAFYADYRPSYRKEPAEDGWKRLLEWFKKNGVA